MSEQAIKSLLVGGAVRDHLLGLPTKDRDFVVVGSTVEQMLSLGFLQVGKDFPVFLHPESRDEYALARTERKTAPGYHGFEVCADPGVTLEQDLERRDLTINAMAMDDRGQLIDPFGGHQDLKHRVLRHVSPAFAEDPLRILRVARFAARYDHLGFKVDPTTVDLMRSMVNAGEVDALVPERVWSEIERAMAEPAPEAFVQVLRQCGALAVLLPEVEALYGVPQPAQYHPEIDTGLHTELALQQIAKLAPGDAQSAFAVLLHDVGKALTPAEKLPSHVLHEQRGIPLVMAICQRLKAPNAFRRLARLVCGNHLRVHQASNFKAKPLYRLLQDADAFRQGERFERFLLACEADARGRTGLEDRPYTGPDRLRIALRAAKAVSLADLGQSGLSGDQRKMEVNRRRIKAIATALSVETGSESSSEQAG
ncbi:MAG: multifunctional CCA protein [Lysobacteraceae bacterium]|nr:MAG: multifunctional CCA protein [Xanthomonadaceae bacterium]